MLWPTTWPMPTLPVTRRRHQTGRRISRSVSTGLVRQGVTETGATSERDRVLESRLDQQQQLAASSGSRLTALDTLQALFTPARVRPVQPPETSEATLPVSSTRFRRWRPILPKTHCARACSRRRAHCRRHLQHRGQPELAKVSLGPGGSRNDQPGERADRRHRQLNQQIQTTSPDADAERSRTSARRI